MPDINPTELVDERLKLALSDPVTGFNARWAAIIAARPAANLPAITIDWSDDSTNYIRHALDPGDLFKSRFPSSPLGIAQYTSECAADPDGTKGFYFDGTVLAHVDFYVVREGGVIAVESKAEAFKHAIVNAALQAVHDRNLTLFQANPVLYNGDFRSIPELVIQTDDGYVHRVPIEFLFTVQI